MLFACVRTALAALPAFEVAPAPAWAVAMPSADVVPKVDAAPLQYRLIDEQVQFDGRESHAYMHVVRVVGSAAGLSLAAQIEREFDPAYQTFTWHHIHVVRNGQVINKLERDKVRLLQRETQLERQMYDGRTTVSVVLDDVRVGDEVDYAFSVRGSNPVFGSKFLFSTWMATDRGPVGRYRVRLLTPASRPMNMRAAPALGRVRTLGDMTETVYVRDGVEKLQFDERAPASVMLAHTAEVSEFRDWAEVARWGVPLFARGEGGSATAAKADEIRRGHSSRQAQVLAALEFVQREVRYFGTETGLNSHLPAPPEQVIAQRFGDCKDKVVLFIALLRRLGVKAEPVLVSTAFRAKTDLQLPSPLAFDHVIARVELDGQSYWLDPTRALQTGDLSARQQTTLGKGLLLNERSKALVALPSPWGVDRQSVEDRIVVKAFNADPELEARITYRAELSEAVQSAIANRGLDAVVSDVSAPYVKVYPKLRSIAPPRAQVSTTDDSVTLVLRYVVPDYWRLHEERSLVGDVAPWLAYQAVALPSTESRRDPYAISLPGVYRHVVTVSLPELTYSEPVSHRAAEGDAHVHLDVSVERAEREQRAVAEVRVMSDEVPAAEWTQHRAAMLNAGKGLNLIVTAPILSPAAFEQVKQALESADALLQQGKLALNTAAQRRAYGRQIVLSAQLAGGRLKPLHQAQVLAARGIQLDHLGQHESARADFERARALDPTSEAAMLGAATNALMTRNFAHTVSLCNELLARQPRHADALFTRGQANYLLFNLAAARRDLEASLDVRGRDDAAFSMLWLSLAGRFDGKPVPVLADARRLPSAWPRPLIDFSLGRIDAKAVVAAASARSNPREALTEAYFYMGEKHLADGNNALAIEAWRLAVEQGVIEYVEHDLARLRLAEARQDTGTKPRVPLSPPMVTR